MSNLLVSLTIFVAFSLVHNLELDRFLLKIYAYMYMYIVYVYTCQHCQLDRRHRPKNDVKSAATSNRIK